ncbi:MAG: ATP-binding protein [Thermoleophilia bacterium]|nr:AAA family ATPase [Gaiellaceae bacterium]MDW8337639.1 ATP-binding protein [Thermoleophilia bacterium]
MSDAAPRPRGRRSLPPERLRRRVDPARLGFASTAEVEPLVGTVGQPRALDALEFGLAATTHGFNVFVAGMPGSGRLSTVLDYLQTLAADRPPPPDWVYVHDFADGDRPDAIALPAGRGVEFARAMDEFVEAARREIQRAFESEEYDRRQREILAEIAAEREREEQELTSFAAERMVALKTTLMGVASIPLVDGKPITREQFEQLPEAEREAIAKATSEVEERAAAFVRQVRRLEQEATRRVRELEREVALYAFEPLLRELRERFGEIEGVLSYLDAVRDDVLDHIGDFRGEPEPPPLPLPGVPPRPRDFSRYSVNVLVDNSATTGAPIVVERNPTYYNLLGRIEYRPAFGAMVTDFREVKAGALHRANGGFLVLEALDVLRHPFAWEALKRAVRTSEVRIESLGEEFSTVPLATLRPEPIPLDVKVVLIGSPFLYHLLFAFDEDLRELFKVKADFSPDLEWTREHERNYAAFVSRCVRDHGLRHFDASAVARVIEHGARLRESQRKLSARLLEVSDVVAEASFWAERAGHELVRAEDVELAIRKREFRSSLLEERIRELIAEGTIVIETEGERVGQVNGLAILDLGDYSFGRPSRVSARVSLGRGRVESIEREIELSGPIHSKGVLILSGYLQATYAQEWPLAVSATLTFEQSYDEVEGDSASSTELYALLSALSGLPLDQGIAVTGSVDQHGRVQAVGGVTRKIEGFYATCVVQGLTGRQGVIVPAANVRNLMLHEDVVEAVRAGRFHVWAVRTIDEGIELLTGRRAGRRRADGTFPPDSVHGLVAARLESYARRLQEVGSAPEAPEQAQEERR